MICRMLALALRSGGPESEDDLRTFVACWNPYIRGTVHCLYRVAVLISLKAQLVDLISDLFEKWPE